MASIKARVDAKGEESFVVANRAGEPFVFTVGEGADAYAMEATMRPLSGDRIELEAVLTQAGNVVGKPRMVVVDGKQAVISIGEESAPGAFKGIQLAMTLTTRGELPVPPQPPVSPALPAAPAFPAPPASPAPPAPPAMGLVVPPPPANAPLPPVPHASAPTQPATFARISRPVYPKDTSLQGRVMMEVDVRADGQVADAKVARSSGHAALDDAARVAVLKWRFNPAYNDGVAVASRVRVPIDFGPDGSSKAEAPGVLDAIQVNR